MAYSNSQGELRGDIRAVVQEGSAMEAMFIGEKVFPIWQSPTRVGQYPKFKLAEASILNDVSGKRAPRSSYPEIVREYTNDTFDCEDRGFEEAVDDVYSQDISRFFDAETMAARMANINLKINHETEVAAALFNTGNFSATSAAVAYTEANIATINFPKDVLDAIITCNNRGESPNTIVISNTVWTRARRSTLFNNYVRGSVSVANAPITMADALNAFSQEGITQILVGKAGKNSNKKGQTFSGSSLWGNTYFWVGNVQGGDPLLGGAGRSINWTEDGGPFIIESYRDEKNRSDRVRARQYITEKVVNGNSGQLITTSYS